MASSWLHVQINHTFTETSAQSPGPCGLGEALAARRLAGPGRPGAVGPRAAAAGGAGAERGAAHLRAASLESIREPRSHVALKVRVMSDYSSSPLKSLQSKIKYRHTNM